MKTPSRPLRAGFTLVEVMLAVCVIVVALLGSYSMLLSCLHLSQTTRETNIAVFDMEAAIEKIISTPYDDIPDVYPDGEVIAEYNNLHLSSEQLTVDYVDPDAEPLVFTITAQWTDHRGKGTRRMSLTSARTR